jgi:hypothetical protein
MRGTEVTKSTTSKLGKRKIEAANTNPSSNEYQAGPTHTAATAAKKVRLSKHTHASNQQFTNPSPNTSPVKEKKENGKNKSKGKTNETVPDTSADLKFENNLKKDVNNPASRKASFPSEESKMSGTPKRATMKTSISQSTTYPAPSIRMANAAIQSCASNVSPKDST